MHIQINNNVYKLNDLQWRERYTKLNTRGFIIEKQLLR